MAIGMDSSIYRCFFILLMVLSTGYAKAEQQPVALGIEHQSLLLGPYFQILEDPTGILTLADIFNAPDQYPFVSDKSPLSQLGDRRSTFWLKLNYQLPIHQSQWVITIEYPHLRDIEVYRETYQGYEKIVTTGYGQKTTDHVPDVYGFGFYLPRDSQTGTLYFRISSDSPLIAPAYLHTLDTVLSHEKHGHQIRGLFYGIFFVMAAFNLFIFFTTRNESYLYYVLYIGAIFVFTLSNDGVIRELFRTDSGNAMAYGSHMLTAIAPIIFGAIFCQHILYTKEKLPIYHRLFNGVIGLSILVAIVILVFGSKVMPRAVMVLTLMFAFIAVSAGVAGLLKKIPTARFFCIAWAAVIIGSLTWIFTLLDLVPYNHFSKFSLQVGAAIETILLSMALGDRIRVLEKERLAIEKQARDQLKESNRQLAASNKFKDEFLSVISHELRTPMNGIFGATELLRFTQPTEEQQSYIDTVSNAGNDMLKMIEDILTYTQCEANTLKENKAHFNLPQLLAPLIAEYAKRCDKNQVRFIYRPDDAVPEQLFGDKAKLRLVLQHLLDNAWKFTDDGQVLFSFQQLNENRDQVRLRFTVQDTGCGVPDDLKETIFESFRQADGSLTRKKGGLGIGLALSKDIVEILKGDLTFTSTENAGTKVTLEIAFDKCDPNNGSIHAERRAAYPVLKPGKHVLVVEDNPVNKLVLESLIKKLGLTVDAVVNGREALDFLAHNKTDVVLMDCQMPVMDGFEASRKIRALNNDNGNVPIIAVTANANPGDKLKCLEAGMNDYIKKPISQNILIDKLANWLNH